jgi:hypothetical protein
MRGRSILTILFLVTSLGTMAGSGPYFDTYTHHMEPGEWELEAGIDAVNPPGKPWAWGQVLELEHGFNAHFASSLYLLGSKLPGESWRLDGYQVEGRFRPWTGNHFLWPTFYLEYEQYSHPETYKTAVVGNIEAEGGERYHTEHEAEARLIFSQDGKWGNVALNLVAERSLDGGVTAFGYTAGIYLKGPSLGKSDDRTFDPDGDGDGHLLAGLEIYGGLGDEGRFGLVPHRQEHYLQPFVAFALGRRTSLKLGVALGLTSGSTDAVRALVTIGL